ncbi:MAG: hypothetical protein KF833_03180 [Verrucomicrobiae bacterium]|nr:hypothetical protein [Verrucomicrobiae bacterium]
MSTLIHQAVVGNLHSRPKPCAPRHPTPASAPLPIRFPVRSLRLAGCLCLTALACIAPLHAADPSPPKRLEDRSGPVESSARPAGSKPGSASNPATPGTSPEPCDTDRKEIKKETTTVEETTVIESRETILVEVPRPAGDAAPFLAITTVVQNTLGLPRASTVNACTDPRYPLPAYAFVGIQPSLPQVHPPNNTLLQRLDVEVETRAAWHPAHTTCTLAIGGTLLTVAAGGEDHPATTFARDAFSDRVHAVTVQVSRSAASAWGIRYVLSFVFPGAESGAAPALRPGDGIALSLERSPLAPPDHELPAFILVPRAPDAPSSLLLVGKSGATFSVLPAANDLALAAFCSVVQLMRVTGGE